MSFLKRVTATTDLKFKAPFVLNDVYGKLPGVDGEYSVSSKAKVDLNYEVELEARSWGIKNLSIHVPKQDISFIVDLDDDDNTEVEVTMTVDSPTVEIIGESTFKSDFGIGPDSINIHDGKITVTFGLG